MNDNIIKRAQKRERNAQKLVYEQLSPKLFPICLRYSSDKQQAEEYLHNGFVKLFTNINKYGFKGAFEGWSKKLIVNLILTDLRKAKTIKIIKIDDDKNILDKIETTEQEYLENVKPTELIKYIQELTPRYRAVLNMYVIEDYSHKEIAKELKITVGTSKSNLFKAKQKLKEILSRNGIYGMSNVNLPQ